MSSRAESFPGLLLPTNLVPSLVDAMRVVTHGHGSWLPGALSSSEEFRVLSPLHEYSYTARKLKQPPRLISLIRNTPALKAMPSRAVNAHCRPCSSAMPLTWQRQGLRCTRRLVPRWQCTASSKDCMHISYSGHRAPTMKSRVCAACTGRHPPAPLGHC